MRSGDSAKESDGPRIQRHGLAVAAQMRSGRNNCSLSSRLTTTFSTCAPRRAEQIDDEIVRQRRLGNFSP